MQLSIQKWIILSLLCTLIHALAWTCCQISKSLPEWATIPHCYENGTLFSSHGWIMASGWQGYLSAGYLIKLNGIPQCEQQKAIETSHINSHIYWCTPYTEKKSKWVRSSREMIETSTIPNNLVSSFKVIWPNSIKHICPLLVWMVVKWWWYLCQNMFCSFSFFPQLPLFTSTTNQSCHSV